jgi:hypothetical protein
LVEKTLMVNTINRSSRVHNRDYSYTLDPNRTWYIGEFELRRGLEEQYVEGEDTQTVSLYWISLQDGYLTRK